MDKKNQEKTIRKNTKFVFALKNSMNMKKLILAMLMILVAFSTTNAQKQTSNIVISNGLYFSDASQTTLYTGEYKEFFDNNALKVEMNIKDGKPEGAYIVYFANGKPNEVRAYRNGEFHGVWRTYNESGMLISEAEYRKDKKNGTWHVWDESGIMRYEMQYADGKKSGTW